MRCSAAASADVVALYTSDRLRVDDPAFREAVTGPSTALPADAVARVVSWYDSPAPAWWAPTAAPPAWC